MKKVVGLGAGGHAKVVLEALRLRNEYDIVGLLDPARAGQVVHGVPVLGGDDLLPELMARGVSAVFVGIGGVKDNSVRRDVYIRAVSAGFTAITVIHPSAIIAASAQVGQGSVVLAGAIINPDVRVGENTIINSGAIVEHDCAIGAHVHVAPGSVLSGGVRVGNGAYIGVGAVVREGMCIGEQSMVAAGAVVVRDVPAKVVVAGVPARLLPVE